MKLDFSLLYWKARNLNYATGGFSKLPFAPWEKADLTFRVIELIKSCLREDFREKCTHAIACSFPCPVLPSTGFLLCSPTARADTGQPKSLLFCGLRGERGGQTMSKQSVNGISVRTKWSSKNNTENKYAHFGIKFALVLSQKIILFLPICSSKLSKTKSGRRASADLEADFCHLGVTPQVTLLGYGPQYRSWSVFL